MPPRNATPRRAASLASSSTPAPTAATCSAGITFRVMVNDASTSILLPSGWIILRYTPTRPAYDGSALPPNGYNVTCHSQSLESNTGDSILDPGTARSVSAMNLRRTPRGKGIVCRVTESGCGRAIADRRCHMDVTRSEVHLRGAARGADARAQLLGRHHRTVAQLGATGGKTPHRLERTYMDK